MGSGASTESLLHKNPGCAYESTSSAALGHCFLLPTGKALAHFAEGKHEHPLNSSSTICL